MASKKRIVGQVIVVGMVASLIAGWLNPNDPDSFIFGAIGGAAFIILVWSLAQPQAWSVTPTRPMPPAGGRH